MVLGKSSGITVTRNLKDSHSANNMWLIQGASGCGKSTLCKNIIGSAAGDKISVVAIDYSGSFRKKDMPYVNKDNYHIIEIDGLGVNLFKPRNIQIEDRIMTETCEIQTGRIYELLCSTLEIKGSSQCAELYAAIEAEISEGCPDLPGILGRINSRKTSSAKSLMLKTNFLNGIHLTEPWIDWADIISSEKPVVFQFSDTVEPKKSFLIELLLNDLWYFVQQSQNTQSFLLILDEIQNMRFGGNCFLSHLREFRKFGIGAIMATQFSGVRFKKNDMDELLSQAATKVYFRPDNKGIISAAKSIDEYHYTEWLNILRTLRVGECVYSGITNISTVPQSFVLDIPLEL